MRPGLKIIFDHERDKDEHAQSLVRHHLKKFDEKYPRISGATMAHVPKTCDCGNIFWSPESADRWECFKCAPPRGYQKEVGFRAGEWTNG